MKNNDGILGTIRDYGTSFVIGAVPAFALTAVMAGAFALASGVATAIGLSSGLAVAAGVVGGAMSIGVSLGVGAIASTAGLFGAAAIADQYPFLNRGEFKPKAVTLGVIAGLAASIGMAFSLGASDAPEPPPKAEVPVVNVIEEAPSISVLKPAFAAVDGHDQANDNFVPLLENAAVNAPIYAAPAVS